MTTDRSRRNVIKSATALLIAVPALSVFSRLTHAAKPLIYTGRFNNLALGGHDAVSYFNKSRPVKGKKSVALEHTGATWLFETEAHRDLFTTSPEKFMPQFGGYCAFSIAKGKIVKGDPKLWHIADGKLYVNFNKGIHKLWLKRKSSLIDKANQQWPDILG